MIVLQHELPDSRVTVLAGTGQAPGSASPSVAQAGGRGRAADRRGRRAPDHPTSQSSARGASERLSSGERAPFLDSRPSLDTDLSAVGRDELSQRRPPRDVRSGHRVGDDSWERGGGERPDRPPATPHLPTEAGPARLRLARAPHRAPFHCACRAEPVFVRRAVITRHLKSVQP